uniref:Glycosyl hydrolase family 32 N-terminal domain-containing protein n=1 Tax=Paramoeba aestuarina TaxID=180227 RepID=A0A7S4UDU1_9EUKA|mmetsp:Transcript_9463/g.14353  ORF Transcript_9463/g.14353 Transcript_9463/m.14353 type:complete len:325 (+) Transcript_9463:99-1073(+)
MNTITSQLSQGHIVREPVGCGQGYWVGCPSITWDNADNCGYLCYRVRRPRGVAPDRGGEVRICKTTDFKNFEDVWMVKKEQLLNTPSMERSVVRRAKDGKWRFFTSCVDPEDKRWITVVIKGDEDITHLDPTNVQTVFKGPALGLEGVKDPWLLQIGDVYHMILSVALPIETTSGDSHDTNDIFNTGECLSATALATSTDLDNWKWEGVILQPDRKQGWDRYCRRISSVVEKNGKYFAFFDGSEGHHQNYEEKCAFAISENLREWKPLSLDAPDLCSPHASKSLRYVDCLDHEGKLHLFYELAREDGAHEMRTITTTREALPFG